MRTSATRLYEDERICAECGEPFWGSARAACCKSACYSRRWRARTAKSHSVSLAEVCQEVLLRRDAGSHAYSKLLPRLFRQAAVELRRRGWDPIELLLGIPDEPATPDDLAPGGVTRTGRARRRWLHAPEKEVELILERMAQRKAAGKPVEWHIRRLETLTRLLQERQT